MSSFFFQIGFRKAHFPVAVERRALGNGYAFDEEFLARLPSANVIKGLWILGCEDKRIMSS